MKCSKCGAELSDDTKFCSYCGQKIEVTPPPVVEETEIPPIPHVEKAQEEKARKAGKAKSDAPKSLADKGKDKGIEIWNKLSLYGKVTTVSIAVFVLLCLVALLAGKTAAVVISIVQVVMAVVSILMHKGVIKLEQKKTWLKWLVLVVAILFTALNVMSYSWGTKTPSTGQNPSSTDHSSDDNVEQIDWANITLSKVLPEPQSNKMDLLYNGDDWLSVTIHDISENDFLEYVRWCKEDYGFTVDCDSFEDYFYAYNQEGYCLTLCYTKASKELSINLDVPTGNKIEQPEQTEQPEPEKEGVPSITKGTEYAYMTDEWNVYIATAISADIIKVENWNKTMSNSKSVSHEYDVGTFKISDSENGFAWVDDEHTTFVLTFTDKNNSKFKKGGTATFTINISDSDKNKGSNYSEDIACFSYQNDDWHLYRAIPLTETLIKIETWYRGSSAGTFLFGYDLCLIDTTSGDTDFEWTDDEHTSFSITMRDEENKYEWKKETFVVFILENEDYTYVDVKSFLGKWAVGDGEAAVPASASDYKYDNYQDVQKELEDAGFSNIQTEILYDIVLGWTNEGEVKSVSIDGRTDYEKGEVFKLDAPIIITYHMKEEDDPNKQTEATETTSKPSTSDSSTSEKKYDLDKNLYVVQCTQDSDKTTMYRITFAECDANGNYSTFYTFDNIINPRTMGNEFNAIGPLPSWFYVGALVHVQANLSGGVIKETGCTVTQATKSSADTTISMPTMDGSSLDSVATVANNYGLSTQYSDEDWGNGSKMRSMSNSKFAIKIVYSSSTKEILMFSVVSYAANSTTQEQKDFIKAIASVACPSSDSSDVSQWVNGNIGTASSTEINGRTYELSTGSSNNLCYSAGVSEWETWDLAVN